jgi:hypothetical protein
MSDDELEFDVSGTPAAAKPQSEPAKRQKSATASAAVEQKTVVKQQESATAVNVSAPAAKIEIPKPKESVIEVSAPQTKIDAPKQKESAAEVSAPAAKIEIAKPKESAAASEEFYIPNTFDKLEAWIRVGKRFKFWLRLKIVCLLPFLLLLIIFIIIYSVSLSGANKKIDRLMSEKEQMVTQSAQDSVKIDELNSTVEKLNADIELLQKAAAKRPAANARKR